MDDEPIEDEVLALLEARKIAIRIIMGDRASRTEEMLAAIFLGMAWLKR